MIPENHEELRWTREELKQFKEYLYTIFDQAAEQGITNCFEASKAKKLCDFKIEFCCRTCSTPDVEEIEINSHGPRSDAGLRVVSKPLYTYYCRTCEQTTMISEASYCPACGLCFFTQTMDEEIFGARPNLNDNN